MKLNTTACLISLAALATAFPQHSTVTAKPSTTRHVGVIGDGRIYTLPYSKNPRALTAEQPAITAVHRSKPHQQARAQARRPRGKIAIADPEIDVEQPPPVFGDAGPVIVSSLPEVEERDDGDDGDDDEYDDHDDGHDDREDRDNPPEEDDQEDDEDLKRIKCLIPEGCVIELAPGMVTSLSAGQPVPTTLPPTRTSSTRVPAPTTTAKHHHRLPPILRRPPPSRHSKVLPPPRQHHTLDHADEAPAPTDGPEVGAE